MPSNSSDSLLPVANGQLSLDASTAPGIEDQLDRLTVGAPIIVQNAVRSESGGTVTVTGTSSFLGKVDLPVTVTAVSGASGPEITARFVLIQGQPNQSSWHFSTSFPDLPPFKTTTGTGGGSDANLLDRLRLSDSAFVLSTAPAPIDPVTQAALQTGLNFVGYCQASDLIGLLGTMVTNSLVLLSGPILVPTPAQKSAPAPAALEPLEFPWEVTDESVFGIQLFADLGIDSVLGKTLRIHQVGMRVYCPVYQSWADANPTFSPVIAASAKLDIPSAGISVDVVGIGLTSLVSLSLSGKIEGVSLQRLDQLLDLVGANDLATYLPSDVQRALGALSALSLDYVSLQLGAGLSITSAGASVGLPGVSTSVLPGFGLSNLKADFSILQPFGSGRAVTCSLNGTGEFLGAVFDFVVDLPEVSATADLAEKISLGLDDLCQALGLPAPAELVLNDLKLGVNYDGAYSVSALMADDPPWVLDLGPVPVTVSEVTLSATHPASGASSGSFGGGINLGGILQVNFSYATPGDFLLRAALDDVSLSQLINALTNQKISLPSGFDFDFTGTSVLIQKSGSDLVFQLATSMGDLGTVAFEAKKTSSAQNTWGYAAGVDLLNPKLSALPGLGGLKIFEDIFQLNELLLVVSSFDDAGFVFPSMAAFNSPTLQNTGNIKLPVQSGGVIAGLNVYANWTLDTSSQQNLLRNFLGLDPSLGITLQVGAVPEQTSRLYVAYSTTILGHPLTCQFGGQIENGLVGLFLTGMMTVDIQGSEQRFDVTLLFVPTGAFISATMQGAKPVDFGVVQLSNLSLEVGINWEGIPSLGVAATINVTEFNSSIAVFFDSVSPSQSMFAGAVSGIDLGQVVRQLAGASVPNELTDVLTAVSPAGIGKFNLPQSVVPDLDGRNLGNVAAAFQQYGSVKLPGATEQILFVVSKAGKSWHLTDQTNMRHYTLKLKDSQVAVELDPQVYCAPQATSIGTLRFPQGFRLIGQINYIIIREQIEIEISAGQGILVDVQISPVVLLNGNFLSLKAASGSGGPRLSLCSYYRPSESRKELQSPHFMVTGALKILGADVLTVDALISTSGARLTVQSRIEPVVSFHVQATISSLTQMAGSGSADVSVNQTFDFGALGSVKVNVGVSGALDMSLNGSRGEAGFKGQFEFQGVDFTLPRVELDVTGPGLLNLANLVIDAVEHALEAFLKDVNQWLNWVNKNVIQGLTNGAEDVGKALKNVYNTADDQIVSLTSSVLSYTENQVADALQGAGLSADAAASVMTEAGYAAESVANAIASAFNNTSLDFSFGHMDTPAGPHVDIPAGPYDIPPHADGPVPPHVDTSTHVDT